MKPYAAPMIFCVVLLTAGCNRSSTQPRHATITVKIVAEYDPDTPAPMSLAKLKLPIEVLGWPEDSLKLSGWQPLYKVKGKYPGDYQLWYTPIRKCYKTLADSKGMIILIEGPYAPPAKIPTVVKMPPPDIEDQYIP